MNGRQAGPPQLLLPLMPGTKVGYAPNPKEYAASGRSVIIAAPGLATSPVCHRPAKLRQDE